MEGNILLALGCAFGVIGVALLRLAWSRKERAWAVTAAGWAALMAGIVAGWWSAGAWGSSVAALWAMGASMLLLAQAAIASPASKAKASNRRVGMLPETGEPMQLGRRGATFLIVVLGGLVSSIALALGIRWLWVVAGASEANANAAALFFQPFAWALLSFFLLMQQGRKGQFALLLITALAAVPAILAGASA